MKWTLVFVLVATLAAIGGQSGSCVAGVTITIESITQNQEIRGKVTGLGNRYGDYLVVVYIHTDVWYVHPFAAPGEGSSWASIKPDGSWSIPTVKRRFPANSVAALVVRRSGHRVESKVWNLKSVPRVAITVLSLRDLRARDFYGKL